MNKAPEIWLELNQDKEATLHAPVKVTVHTTDAVVHASNTVEITAGAAISLTAPVINLNGNLASTSGSGGATFSSSGPVRINAAEFLINEENAEHGEGWHA